jgi:hypothetical protein
MQETLSFTSTILEPDKVKRENPRPAGFAIFSQTLKKTTAHLVVTPSGNHQSSYEKFLSLHPPLKTERKSWNPDKTPFLPDEPFLAVGLAYPPLHPIPAVYGEDLTEFGRPSRGLRVSKTQLDLATCGLFVVMNGITEKMNDPELPKIKLQERPDGITRAVTFTPEQLDEAQTYVL